MISTVRHEKYHQRCIRSQNGALEKFSIIKKHVLKSRGIEFWVCDTLAITDILVQSTDGQYRQSCVEHVIDGYVKRIENRLKRYFNKCITL